MNSRRLRIFDAAAIVFDVDGTLVDSVDLHAGAWQRAFAEFGCHFDFSSIRSQIGKGGDQLFPVFLNDEELRQQGPAIEEYRGRLFERDYMPSPHGVMSGHATVPTEVATRF